METTVIRIAALVRAVEKNPNNFGVYSTGERIAVALVLNRLDLFPGWTVLEAVDRLGAEWFLAALKVQREGR